MSEFSESYHLRSERQDDAVELLRRADLAGFVFKPINGWVTFVAEDGSFDADERVVTAAGKKTLLHYTSTEDHGWSFTLFAEGKPVTAYRCAWDSDVEFDDSTYSRAVLVQHIPVAKAKDLTEFETHLRPESFDEAIGAEASKLFAEAVGLENFEWLSFDYMDSDYDDTSDDFKGVVVVD